MKKVFLFSLIILVLFEAKGQTGIGTNSPDDTARLEIVSSNKGILIPRVSLTSTIDVATIANPVHSLLVFNTATTGEAPNDIVPGYYYFDEPNSTWRKMITDHSLQIELDKIGVPRAATYKLENSITDFLNDMSAGNKQTVPVIEVLNAVGNNAVSFNSITNTIAFKPGAYQITFVYEALHDQASCTLSSYFVDFPASTGTSRVHSTESHNQGGLSNHGNSIIFTTVLTAPITNWVVQLGRGQSGNCAGTGNTLLKNSTHLNIIKLR